MGLRCYREVINSWQERASFETEGPFDWKDLCGLELCSWSMSCFHLLDWNLVIALMKDTGSRARFFQVAQTLWLPKKCAELQKIGTDLFPWRAVLNQVLTHLPHAVSALLLIKIISNQLPRSGFMHHQLNL